MNAVLLLSSGRRLPPDDELLGLFHLATGDALLAARSKANDAETAMAVSFVGLTPAEQLTALASFPGARRCTISEN